MWLNGQFTKDAALPLDDLGVSSGVAVYELVPFFSNIPIDLDSHIQRFISTCEAIGLTCPYQMPELEHAVTALIGQYPSQSGIVRLYGSPGSSVSMWAAPEGPPSIAMSVYDHPGVPDSLSLTLVNAHPNHEQIKITSLFSQYHALQVARSRGFDDAVMSENGRVIGTSHGNLFIIKDGCIITPALTEGAFPGHKRAQTMQLGAVKGIPIDERQISTDELITCDAAFVTSSELGICPVSRIDTAEKDTQNELILTLLSTYTEQMTYALKHAGMGSTVVRQPATAGIGAPSA